MAEILENPKISLEKLYGKLEDSFVDGIIQKRISELKIASRQAYVNILLENKQEEDIFTGYLQNSYSDFFRNSLTFSVLEKIIMPALLEEKKVKDRELRIWSSACASGQEPYSVAMLLEEYKSIRKKQVRYRIFATDYSEDQVKQAEEGSYSSRALGSVNQTRLNRWFNPISTDNPGERYNVCDDLKKNIVFSVFDLLDDRFHVPANSIFGNFDIVFCANLLFYYKKEYREKILTKVTESLSDKGLIVVGETERYILQKKGFRELYSQSGIFQL